MTARTRIGFWQTGQRNGATCPPRKIRSRHRLEGSLTGGGGEYPGRRTATSGGRPRWRAIAQAEWVKKLKRVSNLWLQEQGSDYADFQWQGGYADFSVSQTNLAEVKRYIAGQAEHHRKLSFQDELQALLRRHEIEWDERYVWD